MNWLGKLELIMVGICVGLTIGWILTLL